MCYPSRSDLLLAMDKLLSSRGSLMFDIFKIQGTICIVYIIISGEGILL